MSSGLRLLREPPTPLGMEDVVLLLLRLEDEDDWWWWFDRLAEVRLAASIWRLVCWCMKRE